MTIAISWVSLYFLIGICFGIKAMQDLRKEGDVRLISGTFMFCLIIIGWPIVLLGIMVGWAIDNRQKINPVILKRKP